MSFLTRLNKVFLLSAILPVWVIFLGLNVAVWGWAQTRHRIELERLCDKAAISIEQQLGAQAAFLQFIGNTPEIQNAISSVDTVADALKLQEASGGREAGANPDNPAERLLQKYQAANPDLKGILLLSRAGTLLAASEKTVTFQRGDEAWFINSPNASSQAGYAELLPGSVSWRVAVMVPAQKGDVKKTGIMLSESPLKKQADNISGPGLSGDCSIMITGPITWQVAGSVEVFENASADLISDLEQPGKDGGWSGGLRFYRRTLNSTLRWKQPVWVDVLSREAWLPWPVALPLISVAIPTFLLAGLLSFLGRSYFARRIVKPGHDLLEAGEWILKTSAVKSMAVPDEKEAEKSPDEGHFDRLPPLQKNLHLWLHNMQQSIKDELNQQASELQRDLDLAKEFQLAYIDREYPRIPAVHSEGRARLEFYHRYEPAAALGGDFFNLLTLGPDAAGIFLADVMGHGTRSALITAMIRTAIDDLAGQGRNARHFLGEMNRQFCLVLKNIPSPLFASAFYFVAETTGRVATFSSAGHPEPFYVQRSMGRIMRLEVPMPRGAALGLIPNETYTAAHCRLIDGDVFIFYTDGIYEAHNAQGDEFGIERMRQIIHENMYKSAREIVDGLMEAVAEFVGDEPIADDICIVSVEVTSKARSVQLENPATNPA